MNSIHNRLKAIEPILSLIMAMIGLATTLPYIIYTKQEGEEYIFDIMIIIVFVALAGAFIYLYLIKKNILYLLISIFVFFHFVVFPFCYTFLLNSNPNNLKIEQDILQSEKSNQYLLVRKIYGKSNIVKQRVLNDLIKNEKDFINLTQEKISENQMFILSNYIVISTFRTIDRGGKHPPEPINCFNIYKKNGSFLLSVNADIDYINLKNLLISEIANLKDLEVRKNKAIDEINSNKFWSYKNVLPYSMNIFITSNLVPKSKIANTIFFIHNIFIFSFLLTMIISYVHTIITNKENAT
ncbi:hypothetical protein SAMN06265349_101743 [Flavobacterium resistens]|uniref:Uncharacterized protein n=1 Tax=Flavobacterium resistens TaxID=443612 RepID=A0A521B6T6_9FLAO|nr:hypothetical protein [Flavobacterium resistens]MRX70255.1 hypothetical protein [Flavobacterium resistens]SMO42814.1 hypothetical protein SAMN06265349_101743 [Flavobacterium resistens]